MNCLVTGGNGFIGLHVANSEASLDHIESIVNEYNYLSSLS
jgi:nucleoside-diphosphate-sugar epimerase